MRVPMKAGLVLLAALLLGGLAPHAAQAAPPPNPLGGPYIFVGGGAGAQLGLDLAQGPGAAFRWGPSLELGGDLGPLTGAIGADLRVPLLTLTPPLDIDAVLAVGLITPTPLVRLYVRLRVGVGWRIVKGLDAAVSVPIQPDIGLRLRLPGTTAAFQIGIAAGPRFVPRSLPDTVVDVELRVGMKFP
jgi:hypothetical protein